MRRWRKEKNILFRRDSSFAVICRNGVNEGRGLGNDADYQRLPGGKEQGSNLSRVWPLVFVKNTRFHGYSRRLGSEQILKVCLEVVVPLFIYFGFDGRNQKGLVRGVVKKNIHNRFRNIVLILQQIGYNRRIVLYHRVREQIFEKSLSLCRGCVFDFII